MNAMTQPNQQAQLHEYYNQANQAFQSGDYALALQSLEQALQFADNEKQIAHIQSSIRTVKEMIPQEPVSSPQPVVEDTHEEPAASGGPNRMLLLTVLVGLICLTPIVMKCIEIFSTPQPKTDAAQATTQTTTQTTGTQTADGTQPAQVVNQTPAAPVDAAGTPASPASTPDVIVDNAAAGWSVSGSGINMRATASTRAQSLAKLSSGESVTMLQADAAQADGYTWSKIKTSSGVEGWVASKFLQQAAAPADAAAPAAPADAVAPAASTPEAPAADVTAPAGATAASRSLATNGVSLRAQPGTKGALITVLPQTSVTVLPDAPIQADGFNWVKIRTERGTTGWIADKFLGQ